jgi:hypothetical protein
MLEQMERCHVASREFDERAIINAAAANYCRPRLKNPITISPGCLAKFGRRQHIESAYDEGVLLIRPGSSFNDPSLNRAQADKELEHLTITPNKHLMFKLHGLDAAGKEVEMPARPVEFIRYNMVPDFYVWCCALGYDARLFSEFHADAVLIIKNREAFRERLSAAVRGKLPEGQMKHGPIGYYDPYTVRYEELVPIFRKNFRFLYQNEYRFAWTLPVERDDLTQFSVELGPLHDIAEFHELT